MTIAELYGKISGSGSNLNERREDLLTSDVFGALLYARDWPLLATWLSEATTLAGDRVADVFPDLSSIRDVSMAFWPRGGLLGREPDVVLRVESVAGQSYGICVEAKYIHGKSNVSVSADDVAEEADRAQSGDQLADQWKQIREENVPEKYSWNGIPMSRRFLLFVTAHPELPRAPLAESLAELGQAETEATRRLFWVGWCSLRDALHMRFPKQEDRRKAQGTDLLLVHLLELLDRKGLWRFHGFSKCIKDMVAEHNHKQDRLFWREKYWSFLATASVIEPLDHVFWE